MAEGELRQELEKCFDSLAEEARELYLDRCVPVLDKHLTPLQFHRQYVAPNKPVVLTDFFRHWPAARKWVNRSYLREVMGDTEVTVAVTPNGYADAVCDGNFVMPEERQMKMNKFLDIMDDPKSAHGVFYIQKQNSNLTEEFQPLMNDIDTAPDWGTEVFGNNPDAVNLWIGDGRAVTSMHRDHYENLYCVLSGSKTFLLIPPTDLPFIPYEVFPAATYKETEGKWSVLKDSKEVPWIAIDPLSPDLKRYPQYSHCQPVEVTVHAGQTLYLPSLWFHHVRQSHGCVAVNFWYDMEFDIKYNYYKFVEKVANVARRGTDKSASPPSSSLSSLSVSSSPLASSSSSTSQTSSS